MPMGRSYWVTFVSGFQKYLSPLSGSNKASHGGGNVGSCCLCGAMVLENMQNVCCGDARCSSHVCCGERCAAKARKGKGGRASRVCSRVWGNRHKHGDCTQTELPA